jgi:DNA polymerase-4
VASTKTASILHVDLDAFFAAVEQRDHPELHGRPVVVGGGPGDRGVVSAASYEARRFGIHSAMPLRTAAALCPTAAFLPVDGRRYASESRRVMAILHGFTPRLEQVSIDEAFLDVAGTEALFGMPEAVARSIRSAIRDQVGLTASVGVATSKLVAKVASDLGKPDGLVVVPPGTEREFLAPLPIRRLWGVGERTRLALADYGVVTIGDLAALPEDLLRRRFGVMGTQLAARARGEDASPVAGGEAAKSISHEHTFDADTADGEVIESTLLALSDGVARRLRKAKVRAATVAVKVRGADFVTHTRQRTLEQPTDQADVIYRAALALAGPEVRGIHVRLLGVAASHLTDRQQLELFGSAEERQRRVSAATDDIRHRFGPGAITRGRLIRRAIPEPFERDHLRAPGDPDPDREPGRRGTAPHRS